MRRQSVGYCLGLVRAGKAYGKQGTIQTILERRTDSDLPQGRTNRCYRKSLYRQSAHFDWPDKGISREFYIVQVRTTTCQCTVTHSKNGEIRAFRKTRVAFTFRLFIKTKAIINIKNDDVRCFKYALLYFFERANLSEKHCERANLYTDEMFKRTYLETLSYPISPNDVHIFEYDLQNNNIVFFMKKVALVIPCW